MPKRNLTELIDHELDDAAGGGTPKLQEAVLDGVVFPAAAQSRAPGTQVGSEGLKTDRTTGFLNASDRIWS